jgi:hypothetical protein
LLFSRVTINETISTVHSFIRMFHNIQFYVNSMVVYMINLNHLIPIKPCIPRFLSSNFLMSLYKLIISRFELYKFYKRKYRLRVNLVKTTAKIL